MKRSVVGMFIVCGLLWSIEVHAFVLPLTPINIFFQILEQVKILKDQLQVMKDRLKVAHRQVQDAEELIKLHKDPLNLKNYQFKPAWAMSNWRQALKELSGGNDARYAELIKAYEQAHRRLSKTQFLQGGTEQGFQEYEQRQQLARLATVDASYSYEDISRRMKAIQNLSEQIKSTPSTKAAVEMNAHLLVELSLIELQTLKMQALATQQRVEQQESLLSSAQFNSSFYKLR